MNIRLPEISPKSESPFSECKLQREPYANILTQMIKTYAEGFVLAINNEWGTGKTTFVKMWRKQLSKEGFETLYFNAWENDFEDGALTALMSELELLKNPNTEDLFKSVVKKGAVLAKNVLPILLKAAASKYLDNDVLQELFNKIADNSEELFQQQIQEYAEKRKGLKDFKDSLEQYIKATSNEKPIVFIIDELDRCRPNYAVDVLEKIKHFFSVPGIVFVLSIDKTQLGHAIRGVYGSDNIDADEYLRRFIDVEYSLPEPDADLFCKYLFDYFDFGKFFNSGERLQNSTFQHDSADFINMSKNLFKRASIPLRLQEKIYAHARIALNSFAIKQYLFPSLFVALIYMKQRFNTLYQGIISQKYSIQQVIDEFELMIPAPDTLSDDEKRRFIVVEAQMAYFYHNYLYTPDINRLYQNTDNGEKKYLIKSKLDIIGDENLFERLIEHYLYFYNYEKRVQIIALTSRIDLMENFKIH